LNKNRLLIAIILLFFYGCGGSLSSISNYQGYRIILYNLFSTTYLWSNQIDLESVNLLEFNSPYEMVEELKYKPKDRWSFVVTKSQNSKLFYSNRVFGFGFAYALIDGNITILYTQQNSPAHISGLKRGDIILKIDQQKVTPTNIKSLLDTNKSVEFSIYRDSNIINIEVTPSFYTLVSTQKEIIHSNIGYLRLDSFNPIVVDEIEESFDFFKSSNIEDLVVDLRYNSGGSVVVASLFLDKLVSNLDGEIQFKLKWNQKYKKRDYIYRFESDKNSLNLNRVVFLTTNITASASEVVINALKPYIEVISVGERTYGKPVGMEGVSDKFYIYYLINFKIENSLGFSDYFDGLDVTRGCESIDDLTHKLGDPNEAMLHKALNFLEYGSCKN